MEEEQSEHLPESMGGENQVEECYEEGDVGEIMVEIVGSDVFVNGVSSQIGDLKGNEWETREENGGQSMDVWDGSRMRDDEVGFCESKANGVLGEEDSVNFVNFPSPGDDADLDNGRVVGGVEELLFVNATKDGVEVVAAESRDSIVETEAVGTDDGIADFSNPEGINRNCDGGLVVDCKEPRLGTVGHACKSDELKFSNEEKVTNASLVSTYQPGYLSPPEMEGHFGESDLVWGELRNHPWWPGQIFDEADASEKALKCYKKDSYLVAYFEDETFAWKDSSALKPFRSHFPQIEKQSNTKGLQSAVNSALEEVSRRVELGLACPCIPEDAQIRIGTQVIDNIGIREEASHRYGVHHSSRATLFEPNKLLEYISNLAPCASSLADRIDLVIARAQLSAFYRYKGYRLELLENDAYTQQVHDETVASLKKTHNLMEGSHPRKERSLTELIFESPNAKDESVAEDLDKSVSLTLSLKCNDDGMAFDGSPEQTEAVSVESFSVNWMLLQLRLVAKDPKKRPNIENSVHAFFLGFKNSIVLHRSDGEGKAELTAGGSGEDFEFYNANDTFWKQRNQNGGQLRIIQSYSAEQLRQEWENRTVNLQPVSLGAEKSVKSGKKSSTRKRFSTGSYPMEPDDSVKRRKQESSPAELILSFADRKCVLSEINLNKTFRRFGMLMESETEVNHESGVAKVIFKRGSDAEVALSSAEKFNIFGPVLVKYQIGYTPLISVKISPLEVPQFIEEETLML